MLQHHINISSINVYNNAKIGIINIVVYTIISPRTNNVPTLNNNA